MNTWRLVLVLAAVLCAQTSPGWKSYQRANDLFVAKKLPECLQAIDEALRLDPKLVPALTLKAKLGMAVNRFDLARDSLERAVALEPGSAYVQFLYGLFHYLQEDLQLALAPFEKAHRLDPRDPRAALYLGHTLESLGNNTEALKLYLEAVRLQEAAGKPEAETMLIASRLLLLLGRLEECGRLIERAVRAEPQSRDVHFEYARLLLKKGEAAEAAREGEIALRLTQGGIPERQVRYVLVRSYQAAGEERKAAEHAAALQKLEAH